MQFKTIIFALLLFSAFLFIGCCGQTAPQYQPPTGQPPQNVSPPAQWVEVPRESAIPADAVKITPEMDLYPPILHSDEFETPVPMGPPIDTKGAEDSAFITPDGNTFYFFFTPDVRVPVERQLLDNVTGLYVSYKQNGEWSEPHRVFLNDPGKLSLDGCEFVQGNEMWFCSAREGNYRGVDLWTAEFVDGKWTNYQNAGEKLNVEYQVGEMHISADGNTMYYHSDRPGGKGGLDIWFTEKVNGEWQTPVNFAIMNSPDVEGWPFISQDGNEFWFTRFYQGYPALFRSKKINGNWTEPELIVSQFAGEPTLDNAGNLYFTHHFYDNGTMLEADIYVAYKK